MLLALILIGFVLILVSAFWNPPIPHLGWLGLAFVVFGAFVLPAVGVH